jgi:hypothetical protein
MPFVAHLSNQIETMWEYRYNHQRFSMALQGRKPMEKLAAILAPVLTAPSLSASSKRAGPAQRRRRACAAHELSN